MDLSCFSVIKLVPFDLGCFRGRHKIILCVPHPPLPGWLPTLLHFPGLLFNGRAWRIAAKRFCLAAGPRPDRMARHETVLLVEDDINDVDLMSAAFAWTACPFSLVSVSHGGDAIQYLAGEGEFGDREQFPDPFLILLD